MGHITSYLLGGLAAVTSWSMVAPDQGFGPSPMSAAFYYPTSPERADAPINRAAKGDRLAPVLPGDKQAVASIEVVGVHDAAITYRDRDGNVLYRTDPLNNVTVIAKGVKLPEVTVRQDATSSVTPVPIDVPAKTSEKTKMPVGCEPSVSAIASPHLSQLAGRCISQLTAPFAVVAAIN